MIKKFWILLLILIAILLVKDRPRSLAEFFHIQKVRAAHTMYSNWYGLKAALSPIDRETDLNIYLDVPFHRQEHSLSCEIASLKMVLEYHGDDISESELISKLAVDTSGPRQGNIWGNPEKGFVGSIDGEMPLTGYGVYEKPIADVASQYRDAKPLNNATLQEILDEVSRGRPVIVWAHISGGRDVSWTTPEGEDIKAIYGEHARVLVGFTGSIDDPGTLFFMDPLYGRVSMSKESFIKNWQKLDNRAVFVE